MAVNHTTPATDCQPKLPAKMVERHSY